MTKQAATKFALSFSPDAVHLLDRDATGAQANDTGNAAGGAWHERGQARFDASDFRGEIKRLRDIARAAQGEDAPVALVIPEEQILYTTVDVDGGDSQRVGQALNGLTPYAVDDLAWDWQKLATGVRVAAVARQTLSEAEEFARRHGFSPSSFIADPANGQFPGTPQFRTDAPEVAPEVAAVEEEVDDVTPEADDVVETPVAVVDANTDQAEAVATAEASGDDATTIENVEPPTAKVETGKPGEQAPDASVDVTVAELPKADVAAEKTVVETPVEATPAENQVTETPPTDKAPAEDKPAEPAAEKSVAAGVTSPVIALAGDAAPGRIDVKSDEPVVEIPEKSEAEAATPTPEVTAEPKAPVLPDRARAVLERAAQARAIRPDPLPSEDRRVGERGGIGALVAMLGALVVALALIWGLGPARQTSVIADTPVEPAPQLSAVPTETAPEVTAPVEVAAAEIETAQTATAEPVQVAQAPVAATPAVVPEAPAAVAPPSAAPVVAAPQAPANAPVASTEPAASAPVAATPVTAAPISADVARALVQGVSGAARAVVSQPAAAPSATATATPQQPAGAATSGNTPPARPTQQARTTPPAANPPANQAAAINQAVRQAAPSSATAVQRSQRPTLRRTAPAQPETAPAEAAPRANATAVSRQGTRPNRRPGEGRSAEPRSSTPATTSAPAATSAPRARPTRKPVEGASLVVTPPPVQVALLNEGGLISRALISDYRAQAGYRQMAFLPARDPMAPRFADARPSKRPAGKKTATDAIDSAAIEAAVKSADQPAKKSSKAAAKPKTAAAAPATIAAGRPKNRPAGKGGATQTASNPSASAKSASRSASTAPSQRPAHASAVETAIADAVKESTATPGAVSLASLRSSDIPVARPQRSGKSSAPVIDDDAQKIALAAASRPTTQIPSPIPSTPAAPSATAAAPAPPVAEPSSDGIGAASEAKAAADLQREAQERAAAEARARAQAAAEEAAAKARNEVYRPPEVDDEPDVRTTSARGQTGGVVAKNATVGGIDTNATQVIGVIGAGRASRGLIRLRNGKVVTVRLGDRIDGGAITSIGKGRINYAKGGRQYSLPMLNGN